MPAKIFFCYAHEDEPLLKKLKTHLKPLQREGLIDVWYDRDISAGEEWERVINEHLNTAQIILLLLSPDFMASDYCYSKEMKRALERHKHSEANVIPIILSHNYWQRSPLKKLQALPTDGKPVKSWVDVDAALFNVAEGIRAVVEQLLAGMKDPHYIYVQATSREPVLFDPLNSQSASEWMVGEWDDSSFFFSEGAFHLTVKKNGICAVSVANATHFSDFAFQTEMTLIEGGGGGLVFRMGIDTGSAYRFYVGREYADLYNAQNSLYYDPAVKAILNQPYLLTVVAKGSNIFLYRNKRYLGKAQDNSATSGKIGLMAYHSGQNVHIQFRDVQVWNLEDDPHIF